MIETLQGVKGTETAAGIISLLARYQMLPQLLREITIDQTITAISCTSEEQAAACEQFYQKNQITGQLERQVWLERLGIAPEELVNIATRGLRIKKFKQASWGHKLESYFLSRKKQLDKVIYSLIQTKDMGVAQELYFRIQAGEQSFAKLAQEYSQGPEAQTGGLMGPLELGSTHPTLMRLLPISQPGQLWPPFRAGEWLMIVRLEKLIPAQLDEPMCHRLLHELFEAWLQEQVSQLKNNSRAGCNP